MRYSIVTSGLKCTAVFPSATIEPTFILHKPVAVVVSASCFTKVNVSAICSLSLISRIRSTSAGLRHHFYLSTFCTSFIKTEVYLKVNGYRTTGP